MRIAFVSDVHANWQALEAVLADLDASGAIDDVVCLGDVVGYGGEPLRCLDRIRAGGWLTLTGNHDRACTDASTLGWFNEDAASAIRWTLPQLDEDRLAWLRDLPERAELGGARLVHASLRDPIHEYVLDAWTAAANLELLGDRLCFHGHTHVPGVFHVERGRVDRDYRLGIVELPRPALVNPGSVGQPRDHLADASYGIWDADLDTFEFRRVPYDREAAKQAIRQARLPERFAVRLDFGY
jgi:diadenosine tetraphosphatase ApaH/serine/threonine PP2A family protein phosphatase